MSIQVLAWEELLNLYPKLDIENIDDREKMVEEEKKKIKRYENELGHLSINRFRWFSRLNILEMNGQESLDIEKTLLENYFRYDLNPIPYPWTPKLDQEHIENIFRRLMFMEGVEPHKIEGFEKLLEVNKSLPAEKQDDRLNQINFEIPKERESDKGMTLFDLFLYDQLIFKTVSWDSVLTEDEFIKEYIDQLYYCGAANESFANVSYYELCYDLVLTHEELFDIGLIPNLTGLFPILKKLVLRNIAIENIELIKSESSFIYDITE